MINSIFYGYWLLSACLTVLMYLADSWKAPRIWLKKVLTPKEYGAIRKIIYGHCFVASAFTAIIFGLMIKFVIQDYEQLSNSMIDMMLVLSLSASILIGSFLLAMTNALAFWRPSGHNDMHVTYDEPTEASRESERTSMDSVESKVEYPRYFNLPAFNTTFTAHNENEANQCIANGGVEVPEFVHKTLRTAYDAGHKINNSKS